VVLPLAVLAALFISLGTPVTWFLLRRQELGDEARALATRLAHHLRPIVEESPDLWRFGAGKLAERFRFILAEDQPADLEVVDDQGMTVYRHDSGLPPYTWQARPIDGPAGPAGHVVVGVSCGRLLETALLILAICSLAGLLCAYVLARLPLRMLGLFEVRLEEAFSRLETTGEELRQAKGELESRVEARTQELRQARDRLAEQQARLRSLAAGAVAAQEEERLRVSRDLHDDVGQLMAAVRLDLEAARRSAETEGASAAGLVPVLEHAASLADAATEQVRRTIRVLGIPLLDQGGIKAAVGVLVSHFEHSGCRVQASVADEVTARRVGAAEICAFRVVQEGLTNALRHGRATEVRVAVAAQPQGLVVTVEDNGQGCEASVPDGFGLAGLRDRVAMLGGAVEAASAPGKGFVLRATIPVDSAAPQGKG
jgi:signal transduction histidine kinase